jgi:hypothetical protein
MHVKSDRNMCSLAERGMRRGVVTFTKVVDRIARQGISRPLDMTGTVKAVVLTNNE